MVVIADDHRLCWPQTVLAGVQKYCLDKGFFVQKMMTQLHEYHLDDAPDLRSCNLLFKALPENASLRPSEAITDSAQLEHFYGRDNHLRVRYVREKKRLDYGKANENEYEFEMMGSSP